MGKGVKVFSKMIYDGTRFLENHHCWAGDAISWKKLGEKSRDHNNKKEDSRLLDNPPWPRERLASLFPGMLAETGNPPAERRKQKRKGQGPVSGEILYD